MFPKPWFSILEVHDIRGRSMADIAAEVCAENGLSLADLRSVRQRGTFVAARKEFYRRIARERPDISSTQAGAFLHRDGSSARHVWRTAA